MRRLLAVTTLALTAACGKGADAPTQTCTTNCNTTPKAITVSFAGGTVNAELATLRAQRETGLMNRTSIAADSGMIFVWSQDQDQTTAGFWMQNTHFDLSIAFIDANKAVINTDEMVKETTNLHFATRPFRYAVEAPKGWFTAHGVTAGAIATFTIPAGVIIDP